MKKQEGLQEPNKHDAMKARTEKFLIASKESQEELYKILEYQRTYSTFKANARYKKSSFWDYLEDIFAIKEKTYHENVLAVENFPEYVLEYGVGMVSKVARVCGSLRVDKVFADIDKEAAAHKTPLSRDKIETIIQKHRIIYEHEKATR